MVDDGGQAAVSGPYEILGEPRGGGILIIADHASAHVPDEVDLGIDPALLTQHIAVDLGVAPVARLLVERFGFAAILGAQSRLVVDLNRHADDPAAIPVASDGHAIPGNALDEAGRAERIARYHTPYHDYIAAILAEARPALIVSLHSFTPRLASKPEELRPWQVGVLYKHHEAAPKLAIALLEEAGLIVGDQLPYSGKLLNATMDRHAEANGIPYVGIEMRQDEVSDPAGQSRLANIIGPLGHKIAETIA